MQTQSLKFMVIEKMEVGRSTMKTLLHLEIQFPHLTLFTGKGLPLQPIGATILNKSLRDFRRKGERKPTKDLIGFAKEFQKRIAKVNSFPWLLGTMRIFAGQLLKVKVLTLLLG